MAQKPKPKAKPKATSSSPTRANASAKASSKSKSSPPKKGGDSSPFHMESYLMGAAHGAQILFEHAKKQMGDEAQGYKKNIQSIPGQAQQAIGQDMDAAFGPNGAIPIGKIGEGLNTAKGL